MAQQELRAYQLQLTFLTLLIAVIVLLTLPGVGLAQTSATATLVGTVVDPQGAVVPGAEVELVNTATSQSLKQTTNDSGHYVFTSVSPGVYKISVTMQGFRQAVIPSLKVEVAKSYTVDVTLEVGEMMETVEVIATVGVEMQKTDATVGTTISGRELTLLPTLDRSAATLLLLQPLVSPGSPGMNDFEGGQVAGARSDQNTYLIDGGDATNDTEASGGYAFRTFNGVPLPVVPVPVESVEEFRVGTTNPNATFSRSAGGQVNLVTKRGTNSLHGSVYWYHQNDNLNANTWDLNRTNIDRPELKDNRYGFSLGGPVIKDKTFLYGHFEGRRFPQTRTITRTVPTDTLKQGILRFTDASGNVVSYSLAGSALCGDGTQNCDPRGLGISPVVRSLWNMLPAGNDPSLGDQLNTTGFRAPVNLSLNTDFFVVRFDQQITDQWNFFASYRYFSRREPDASQVDIAGLVSGKPGEAVAVAGSPFEPRYLVAGLTGQVTPRLTSDFRFSYARNFWEWARQAPFPQVAGTAAALQLAGEPGLVDEPINIDTQRARSRFWNGRDYYFSENLSWITGDHTLQFGVTYRRYLDAHSRTDKVFGGLSTGPIYWLDADQAVNISAEFRPPTCGGGVTTNCLQPGDVGRWDSLYAATLGLVDHSAQIGARDGQLNPLPLGTSALADVKLRTWEFYVQDIWRVNPSFTVNYGLTYSVQVPPQEKDGKQMMIVFKDTNRPVIIDDYFRQRAEAARRGETFNPELAYSPVGGVGRKYPYDIDWNNFGPRVAAAWNPSFTDGFLGRLFGDRQTVIRGGYSLTYDRKNGVGLVMVPLLGVGLMEALSCQGPDLTGECITSTDPTNAFRIGVDGSSVPIPAQGPGQIPFPVGAPFGETLSFMLDPKLAVGESHGLNFTIQRELPWDMLLELGYVGRLGRNLTQGVDLNAMPLFHRDPASGQSFAQAFDALAMQLRAGVDASAVAAQPWFENQLGAGMTTTVADNFGSDLVNGDVFGVMIFGIDLFRSLGIAGFEGAPFNNMQLVFNNIVTDGGRSNYHAFFASLRKRFSNGLTFSMSYTLSKSLDQIGLNQQYIADVNTPFDFDIDYTPSLSDRRHAFNVHWFYDLPFGRAGRFATGNWTDKLFGGWFTAGIFTANSGLPLCVVDGGSFGAAFSTTCAIPNRDLNVDNKRHLGVTGSGGVGTNGDVNLFANPEEVFNSFRRTLKSQDGRIGQGALRGQSRWGLDVSLGKRTMIAERVGVTFSFDFLNIFNHVELNDPNSAAGSFAGSLELTTPQAFGVIDSQFNQERRIQFGLRIEF